MAKLLENIDKASHRMLFGERMQREGRYDAWMARVKQLKAEKGMLNNAALNAAMPEFGYVSAAEERRMAHEFMDNLHKDSATQEAEKIAKTAKVLRKAADLDYAMAGLPDTADTTKEIDWIRSHPAMLRSGQEPTKHILITVDDVLHAPNGKAPSRSAVSMLQHWANHAAEFHKNLLSEQKKKADSGGESGGDTGDEDVSEVERLLKEVKGGISTGGEGGRRSDTVPVSPDQVNNSVPADCGRPTTNSSTDPGQVPTS